MGTELWPAIIALMTGGWLARYVLWPLEMKLQERGLHATAARIQSLEEELKNDR